MRIILTVYKDSGPWAFAPVRIISTPVITEGVPASGCSAAAASPPLTRVKRVRVLLGTLVAVEAIGSSTSAASAAVEAAFTAVTRVAQRMHPLSPDGDLARINTASLGTPVTVHTSTYGLLELAHQLNTLTNGVFDPCLPRRKGRLRDIELSSGQVIRHAPVALDFGGFAKGYAVDCAVEALLAHECCSGLVNAGGDLRVFGPHVEPTLLRDPSGALVEIALSDAALAVSDTGSPSRPPEHQGYYVRRDDTSRASERSQCTNENTPVHHYAAVTAKQAVIADALAKCVLLCPRETAARALAEFDAARVTDQ